MLLNTQSQWFKIICLRLKLQFLIRILVLAALYQLEAVNAALERRPVRLTGHQHKRCNCCNTCIIGCQALTHGEHLCPLCAETEDANLN